MGKSEILVFAAPACQCRHSFFLTGSCGRTGSGENHTRYAKYLQKQNIALTVMQDSKTMFFRLHLKSIFQCCSSNAEVLFLLLLPASAGTASSWRSLFGALAAGRIICDSKNISKSGRLPPLAGMSPEACVFVCT